MSKDISVDQVSMVFYGRGEPVIEGSPGPADIAIYFRQ